MSRHPQRWGQIALILIGLLTLLVAVLFKANHDQGRDIKAGQQANAQLLRQIQQSRVFLTKRGCRQRNAERAVTRANLQQNKSNLAQIPDEGLAQLGFTRAEAVAQIDKQIRQVHPLDCKRQVRDVAGKKAGPGGGSGASTAPRPQGPEGPPEKPGGRGGGPDATQPERPPEGGPSEPKPPPGDGQPAPGNPSAPSEPEPSVKPPVVTVPDVRDLPRQIAPGVCQINTPLGPILKLCP